MIAAQLRGGNKPSLNEALGWIGSRVDDIYGANVGRLDDVWIDPGTGAPRWLLVKEGRFGGRTTLIPFEDATAGTGHIWVPYEREIVRQAPEIEPGAPLTHQVEATLRSHYAASAPSAISGRQEPPPAAAPPDSGFGSATIRLHGRSAPAPADRFGLGEAPPPVPPPQPPQPQQQEQPPRYEMPSRPAPPVAAPRDSRPPASEQGVYLPAQPAPQPAYQPPPQQHYAPPPQQEPQAPAWSVGGWQAAPPAQQPPPAPDPVETLSSLADAPGVHYVEIELVGELSIRGELRSVRVIPRR